MLASRAQKGSEKWAVRTPQRVSFPPHTAVRACALLPVSCALPARSVALSLADPTSWCCLTGWDRWCVLSMVWECFGLWCSALDWEDHICCKQYFHVDLCVQIILHSWTVVTLNTGMLHVWFRNSIARLRMKPGIFCNHVCPLEYDGVLKYSTQESLPNLLLVYTLYDSWRKPNVNKGVNKHLKKKQRIYP